MIKEELIELEKHNFTFRTLSAENSLLDIRYRGSKISDEDLTILEKYASYVTWLNLSDCRLGLEQLQIVSKMKNLTRLYLQKNPINTKALKPLLELKHLEILNLHSTNVDNEIFDFISSFDNLKKVFLWNTRLTSKDILKQANQSENIELIGGLE